MVIVVAEVSGVTASSGYVIEPVAGKVVIPKDQALSPVPSDLTVSTPVATTVVTTDKSAEENMTIGLKENVVALPLPVASTFVVWLVTVI
jgi:hypothetical protein